MKTLIKSGLKKVFNRESLFQRMAGHKLFVFLYHDVSDTPCEFSERYQLYVTKQTFRKQIEWIKESFHVVTPRDLCENVDSIPKDKPWALITFDDGMPGLFEAGVPILREFQCHATFFLNFGPLKGDVFWSGLVTYLLERSPEFVNQVVEPEGMAEPNYRICFLRKKKVAKYLESLSAFDSAELYADVAKFHGGFGSFSQVMKIDGDPLFTFGNHLYNHYNSEMMDKDELIEAYLKNHEELGKLKSYYPVFSYPFGNPKLNFSTRTHRILKSLGEKSPKKVFSSFCLPNENPKDWLLHRVSMFPGVEAVNELRYRTVMPSFVNRWTRKSTYQAACVI